MLKNRPAAFLCLVFSAGMAAGLFFAPIPLIISAVAGMVIAAVIKERRKTAAMMFLSAAALLIGCVYASLYSLLSAPHVPEAGTVYTFYAAVREVTPRNGNTLIQLEVQDENSVFDGERMYMFLDDGIPAEGAVVEATGTLSLAKLSSKSNGVTYNFSGNYVLCEGRQAQGLFFNIMRLRKWIGGVIGKAYNGDAAEFYRGIITGDRSGLDVKLNASFSRSGIAHIMAISGQHFTLIVFSAVRLLMRITKRKKLCYGLGIALAVAYAVFTGASPSITRAAFMCCAMFAAKLINDRSDPLINLCAALAVVLVFSPYALFSISLQLSFLATAGIIFVFHHIDRRRIHPKLRWIVEPVVMSVASSLFCTPVFLSRFDYISIIAPLTNVVVNLLVMAAMAGGILLLPFALLFEWVALIPEQLYYCIRLVSDFVAAMRFACVSVTVPYIRLLFVPSLAAVVVFAAFRLKKGTQVFLGATLATAFIVAGCMYAQHLSNANNATVYVHDTEASSFILYANGDGTVLLDGYGRGGIGGNIFDQGYTYIDAYIVTVCTEDSLLRLQSSLPYAPVHTLYIPAGDNDYSAQIERLALSSGCKVQRYPAKRLRVGGLTVYTSAEDEVSGYVVSVNHKGGTLMVYGDAENVSGYPTADCDGAVFVAASENSLIPQYTLPDRINKVFVSGSGNNIFYNYNTNFGVADSIERYDSRLVLRLGENGVTKE